MRKVSAFCRGSAFGRGATFFRGAAFRSGAAALALVIAGAESADLLAQSSTSRGSPNIDVLAHVPLGGPFTVSDLEIE
ncbi:MAG: hypothetical protein KAI98_06645, partial [Gemmatimonadetes bacterium]|nr:hypothetical protein [Gemmatimonadota bacterium]